MAYCTVRKGWMKKKKGEGPGRMGRERENELISSSPPVLLRWTCCAAWWHVVWKAISSAICISLLPAVLVTVWLPGSKSLLYGCCLYQDILHTHIQLFLFVSTTDSLSINSKWHLLFWLRPSLPLKTVLSNEQPISRCQKNALSVRAMRNPSWE